VQGNLYRNSIIPQFFEESPSNSMQDLKNDPIPQPTVEFEESVHDEKPDIPVSSAGRRRRASWLQPTNDEEIRQIVPIAKATKEDGVKRSNSFGKKASVDASKKIESESEGSDDDILPVIQSRENRESFAASEGRKNSRRISTSSEASSVLVETAQTKRGSTFAQKSELEKRLSAIPSIDEEADAVAQLKSKNPITKPFPLKAKKVASVAIQSAALEPEASVLESPIEILSYSHKPGGFSKADTGRLNSAKIPVPRENGDKGVLSEEVMMIGKRVPEKIIIKTPLKKVRPEKEIKPTVKQKPELCLKKADENLSISQENKKEEMAVIAEIPAPEKIDTGFYQNTFEIELAIQHFSKLLEQRKKDIFLGVPKEGKIEGFKSEDEYKTIKEAAEKLRLGTPPILKLPENERKTKDTKSTPTNELQSESTGLVSKDLIQTPVTEAESLQKGSFVEINAENSRTRSAGTTKTDTSVCTCTSGFCSSCSSRERPQTSASVPSPDENPAYCSEYSLDTKKKFDFSRYTELDNFESLIDYKPLKQPSDILEDHGRSVISVEESIIEQSRQNGSILQVNLFNQDKSGYFKAEWSYWHC
jgi:hypothetical protein